CLSHLKERDPTPHHIQAGVTMKTNFFGTLNVNMGLFTLNKTHGKSGADLSAPTGISSPGPASCPSAAATAPASLLCFHPAGVVCCFLLTSLTMVLSVPLRFASASSCSFKSWVKGFLKVQQKFQSETITEEELVGLMNKFVEDTKNKVHEKEGWPNSAYGVTKIGVTVLSRIHARKLNEERRGDRILLNACCPGWVRTDMAGPSATKSPEEGAETPTPPTLLVLGSESGGPQVQFISEKKPEQW
ncbi:LOW QUALITY PROTEIN: carbonyl reductase [NADPH] 1-like, partial [Fukomys damarensis]|uniref:LOW QUALITY PROTEIN: carbonyl reductase [NADPH] 1-like n=1 Tax=Fukomys damarensis TaxID=885580 RepID=UPI0014553002